MATLYVRNVPEELLAKIWRIAEASGQSINDQVIELLTLGLQRDVSHMLLQNQPAQDQRKILAEVNHRRRKLEARARKSGIVFPDVTDLIRADRDR
jgi:antitoxin FitA